MEHTAASLQRTYGQVSGKQTCYCVHEPAPGGPIAPAAPGSHGPAVPAETSAECVCGRNARPVPPVLSLNLPAEAENPLKLGVKTKCSR